MTELEGEVNLPLVDPIDTFKDDFGLDLSQQVCVSQATPKYFKLKKDIVEDFVSLVRGIHGDKPTKKVRKLLDDMKTASNQPTVGQTYDHLVREALGCSGYIRGDGKSVRSLAEGSTDTYRDFYRLTQAFLSQQQGTRSGLYRGLYPEEIAPILAAVLEQPDNPIIELESTVVSSFSLSEKVSQSFSRGLICEFDPQDTGIAFAPDCFFKSPKHTGLECEFHVLTGAIQLPTDKLLVYFHDRDTNREPRRLRRTIQSMNTPATLDAVQHRDIARLLDIIVEEDLANDDYNLTVQTPDANERLWNWIDYTETQSVFSENRMDILTEYTTYIVGPRNPAK
ncbi:hypothetical protein [Haloferax denitrificans]|uniref:hypothetical protein n=1 Tax=Haloferax denitrificans TaxID=35745 RepID=UPI0009FCE415|nr:hypothetical protein [Haloferax denitrificans]